MILVDDLSITRYWENAIVSTETGCWSWYGATCNGYGFFTSSNVRMAAHRFSYAYFNRVDPGDLFVCHRCDNPICSNPHHLFLGTPLDNVRDCVLKGRKVVHRGPRVSSYLITRDQAIQMIRIRSKGGVSTTRLAKAFGLSTGCVARFFASAPASVLWRQRVLAS